MTHYATKEQFLNRIRRAEAAGHTALAKSHRKIMLSWYPKSRVKKQAPPEAGTSDLGLSDSD